MWYLCPDEQMAFASLWLIIATWWECPPKYELWVFLSFAPLCCCWVQSTAELLSSFWLVFIVLFFSNVGSNCWKDHVSFREVSHNLKGNLPKHDHREEVIEGKRITGHYGKQSGKCSTELLGVARCLLVQRMVKISYLFKDTSTQWCLYTDS